MFRRPLIAAAGVLFLTAGVVAFLVIESDSGDVRDYERFVQEKRSDDVAEAKNPALQHRRHVVKDLWTRNGGHRLRHRLESERSTIEYTHENGQTEVVEHMVDTKGYMQEALFYIDGNGNEIVENDHGVFHYRHSNDPLDFDTSWKPMQILRYIEADKASYSYGKRQLTAQGVSFTRFCCPGHDLVTDGDDLEPLVVGKCSQAYFELKDGEKPSFHAKNMQAKVYKAEARR